MLCYICIPNFIVIYRFQILYWETNRVIFSKTFETRGNELAICVRKPKRSASKGRFTRAVNTFEAILLNDGVDKENVIKYFEDVEMAWKGEEEKHEDYISRLNSEDELSAEENWIVDVQTIFQGIRERYVKFVYNFNMRSDLQLREKARCIENETFLKLYGNLEKSVKNKYPPETITREKILLERQFETVN